MYFPILIPYFCNSSTGLFGGSYVKSGDKYTTEWWQNELNCYVSSKQKLAACLIMLERQGMVKKIKKKEFDVVKFKPIKPFSNLDIVKKLKEKIL